MSVGRWPSASGCKLVHQFVQLCLLFPLSWLTILSHKNLSVMSGEDLLYCEMLSWIHFYSFNPFWTSSLFSLSPELLWRLPLLICSCCFVGAICNVSLEAFRALCLMFLNCIIISLWLYFSYLYNWHSTSPLNP